MADTELQIGAQTRAARRVLDGLPEVTRPIEDLGASLEAAMAGFRGASAAALVEAVAAWFEAARDLEPALAGYAQRLVATDVAAAQTESSQQERYSRLASRLGGAQ